MSNNPEINLIIQLRNGSIDAFDAIYESYAESIYTYAFQMTKSHHEAEDIVQDVFMRLWNFRKRINDIGTIKPLLFKIAKARIVDALRARLSSPLFENYIDHINSLSTSEHSTLEYNEFVDIVSKALDKLPKRQQVVIKMIKFEGLQQDEVAKKLGLNIQTVRNVLSMGLKSLGEILRKSSALLFVFLLFIFRTNS